MATGISPEVLAELDDWWLTAMLDAHAERWGVVEELLAVQAELLHASFVAFLKANAKSGSSMPRPLQIARPSHRRERKSATHAEIHAFFRGGD